MGENLSKIQRNILAWVLTLAVLTLIGVMGFTIREIAELQKRLPKDYVLLEQYRVDQNKIDKSIGEFGDSISKIDDLDKKINILLSRSK